MAHRTPLKDAYHHVIGYIDTDDRGRQTLKDEHYHTLGHYDPATNTTKDDKYRVVGRGNLLTTLLRGR